MRFFRNHIVFRSVGWFMALYVLNFSVDAPDAQSDYEDEDLSINDLESIAEIVLEEWMGIEDAVPEHDEPDAIDGTMSFKKSFDFFCVEFKKSSVYVSLHLLKNNFQYYRNKLHSQFSPEFTPPPPKA
ncbi:MAG: hypothetical protein ABJG41_14440 [Cyclobacteriaceae bacterium]